MTASAGKPLGSHGQSSPSRRGSSKAGKSPARCSREYWANFIAVVGLSPQVVTETIYCLSHEEKTSLLFRSIRLITTQKAWRILDKSLLDPDKGALARLRSDYPAAERALAQAAIDVDVLRDSEGRRLDDIFTSEDSISAADQIYRVVLDLAREDGVPIIASVAGGRKTMGIYLAMAMELAGRPGDRLLHVLVNEPFDRLSDFYYPPPKPLRIGKVSTRSCRVSLVDLPFMKTGPLHDRRKLLRSFQAGGVAGMLRSAESSLCQSSAQPGIRIDLQRRTLEMAGRFVSLTPRELGFYWFLATGGGSSGDAAGGIPVARLARSRQLVEYIRAAESSQDEEDSLEMSGEDKTCIGGGVEGVRQLRSKINRKLRLSLPDHVVGCYEIRTMGQRHDKRYAVLLNRGEQIRIVGRSRPSCTKDAPGPSRARGRS